MSKLDTQILPLLPLTTGVVLPGMVVTLTIESDDARTAVSAARATGGELLLVPRVESRYARVGTVGKVEDVGSLPSGMEAVVIRGMHRATIGAGVPGTGDATWVQVEPSPDPSETTERARELAREYRAVLENIVESRGVPQVAEFLRGIQDPGAMADTAGYSPDLSFEQKVEILETLDVEQRLEKVLAWSRDILGELSLKDKIRQDVREGMEKTQREYLLRQQMDAIKKELGDEGGGDAVAEYRRKIEESGMPEGARREAERELGRLEQMSEQSPEYGWIRTYLDWMTEIPWSVRTEDNLDIGDARRILDEDHTGLSDVKDRIIEYLAVRKLRQERGLGEVTGRGSGAILTLVGPPGVGKTSLGE
jgi:ATP-dependent Lon protease